VVVALAAVALTACQTGERPSFDTTPDNGATADTQAGASRPVEVATGGTPDNATTARSGYTDLFDTSSGVTETAVYTVVQTAQQVTAIATLSRDGDRTVVEVRGVQYRGEGDEQTTCVVATGACEAGYDEQPLSDLQITSGFWGPAVVAKLASPTYRARIGPVTTSTITVAGQDAVCVDIPGPDRTDRYCALKSGALAAMDTAYVRVELTSYEPSFDESVWAEVDAP